MVTGVAAGIAGPAVLVGLGIAGVAATCNALSSAQLAAEYPHSGGTSAFGRPWVATVVSIGGVTAMLGVILSQLLGLSRMVFAMSRRGDLPPALNAVHPRYGVPGRRCWWSGRWRR